MDPTQPCVPQDMEVEAPPMKKTKNTHASDQSQTLEPSMPGVPGPSGATSHQSVTKPKKFQQMAKNFLLTFPQFLGNKIIMWNLMKGRWKDDLVFASIAEEEHEDGSPHMHCVVSFKQSKRFANAAWADFIAISDQYPNGKHGNYKTIKNSPIDLARALRYVAKDKKFALFGDINEELYKQLLAEADKDPKSSDKKTQQWLRVVQLIENGTSLDDLAKIEDYKAFVANNLRKLKEYFSYLDCRPKEILPENQFMWMNSSIPLNERSWDLQYLLHWFNSGQHVHNRERPIRAKTLYLISPIGAGKTTLLTLLASMLRIYSMPDEDFYCTWDDKGYDLAVLDEFRGNKSLCFLNKWLDGQHLPLRRKGDTVYVKKHNVPTLVISNFGLRTLYSEAEAKMKGAIEPTLDRCQQVILTVEEIRSLTPVNESSRGSLLYDEEEYKHPANGYPGKEFRGNY